MTGSRVPAAKNRPATAAIAIWAGLSLGSFGCTSPTSPNALPFRSGTYLLLFSGGEDACPGMAAAGIKDVATTVTVKSQSGAWRAVPQSSAAGDFVLTFSPGPTGPGAPGGGPGVTATLTGTVITTSAFFGVVEDSRLIAGSGVTLSGGLSADGIIGSGSLSGTPAFANSAGVTVNCKSSPGTMPWMISWQSN